MKDDVGSSQKGGEMATESNTGCSLWDFEQWDDQYLFPELRQIL
jgi:hypothetical protein